MLYTACQPRGVTGYMLRSVGRIAPALSSWISLALDELASVPRTRFTISTSSIVFRSWISPCLRLRLGVAGHVLWPWQGKRFGVDSPTPVPARDIAMLRIYYPFVHTLFTAVHFVSLRCPLGGESRVCCSVRVTVTVW